MPETHTTIGSLAWARRTGGRLSAGDRLAFALGAIRELLRQEGDRALRRLGMRSRRQVEIALGEIALPETPAARAAAELCRGASSPALAGHCERTYLWGALLGARDGIAFDSELLYVACLLHDLGLTGRFAPQGTTACFALAGALAAESFGRAQSWPEERAQGLAEAICRHLNPRVDLASGPEAHLVRQGSGLDVAGLRFGEIAPLTRAEVLVRHPRLGLKEELARHFADERRARPRSRIALLDRLGFGRRVARAPFSD